MNAPLKADVTAADRLLKAAVRRAVEDFREAPAPLCRRPFRVGDTTILLSAVEEQVSAMLTAAGTAAELLLGEAS
jgi:hypothetical protein